MLSLLLYLAALVVGAGLGLFSFSGLAMMLAILATRFEIALGYDFVVWSGVAGLLVGVGVACLWIGAVRRWDVA